MTGIRSYDLSDGTTLPAIGFGTYPLTGADATRAVTNAIDAGYRLLDSAMNYKNEDALGRAVAASPVPRDELIVTTKLPGRHHGYDKTMASFEESRAALALEYIDLYLIHWPNPSVDQYVESFKAMIELQRDGRIRTIGVSNFTREFLLRLQDETGVMPAVNQVEMHPYFPQVELRAFHAENDIRTESWSPLGRGGGLFTESPIVAAASGHDLTPAQVVLRWQVQCGSVPIPKSADPLRQKENYAILDSQDALSDEEMDAITSLGTPDGRLWDADPIVHEEM